MSDLIMEHYEIYSIDENKIENILNQYKNVYIEHIPITLNENPYKLLITLFFNLGYTISEYYDKTIPIDFEEVQEEVCECFSFDETDSKKEWSYNGIDIEHCSVLASTGNIQDSLEKDDIEYFMERRAKGDDYDMFRLLFLKIYQYGYSIGRINYDSKKKLARNRFYELMRLKNRSKEEDEEFTKMAEML